MKNRFYFILILLGCIQFYGISQITFFLDNESQKIWKYEVGISAQDITPDDIPGEIVSITIDETNELLYLSTHFNGTANGIGIFKADFDGEGFTSIFINPNQIGTPSSIYINEEASKVYWFDFGMNGPIIQQASTNGGNVTTILELTSGGVINDFYFDEENNYIYWMNGDRIWRSDFNGLSIEELINLDEPSESERDVIATYGESIFWNFYRDDPDGITSFVMKSNIDGMNIDTLYDVGEGEIFDIQIDTLNQKIYWAVDEGAQEKIRRMNFDGTEVEDYFAELQAGVLIQGLLEFDFFYPETTNTNDVVFGKGIELFPNPSTGTVYLKIEEQDVSREQIYLRLHNIFGQEVYSTMLDNLSNQQIDFDLPNGKYYGALYRKGVLEYSTSVIIQK